MSKSNIFVMVVLVFLALFAVQAFAAGEGMKMGSKHEARVEGQSLATNAWKATDINGAAVNNTKGEKLGTVEDLVIGNDGRVEYLILSSGGFLDIGDKLIPIPWEAVKPGREADTFTVDITKERLAKAPSFGKDKWPDFASREAMREYHGYYMSDSESGARSGSKY